METEREKERQTEKLIHRQKHLQMETQIGREKIGTNGKRQTETETGTGIQ